MYDPAGGGFPIRARPLASGTNIRGSQASCRSAGQGHWEMFPPFLGSQRGLLPKSELTNAAYAFLTVPFQQPQQFFYCGNCGSNNSFSSSAWRFRTILSGHFEQHAKSFCERKLSASELEIITTLGGRG
jgi:hypothetical protein